MFYPFPARGGFILAFVVVVCSLIFARASVMAQDTLHTGEFYVSVDGSDDAAGTENAPWRSIQIALDRADAGSTIYVMEGVYNEFVRFPRSGSAEAGAITLRDYPDHTPIIDGTDLPIEGEAGLIVIEDQDYINVIGFEVRNLKAGGNPDVFPAGIWVRGHGAFIEVRNNRVHDIENSCEACGAHGIAIYGRDPEASINHLIIDNNEVYNGKFGWSESLVLNGNVEQFTVSNNRVHDNDNIGMDFIGHEGENPDRELDRARDGVVFGNHVYNIDTLENPAYYGERSAGAIYVDGGTRILIERNVLHDSNIGIELASEWAGKDTSYITLRNNFIYNNTQVGIAIGGYDEERGATIGCMIVNNTLYNNATAGDWGAELYIQYDTRQNVILNNLIFANESRLFMESWSSVMQDNMVDYNLYFAIDGGTDGSWVWQGASYEDFAAYQTASGNDANSLIGQDPRLVDPANGDLHLQPDSPAQDAGTNHAEIGESDIDDMPRSVNQVDVGAHELE